MIKTEKPPVDPELKRRIQDLIDYKGGGFNQENVADIIENALKLLKDVEDSGDVRVIQTAVRELRYAFRLFAPYADKRKVTIFGSARTQPSRVEYQQGVEFGRKIAEAGFMVITGAGVGIMHEGYEALTLMQTGKSQLMPLVLIDRPGGTYWKTWDKHVREHLLRDQLISPDDLNLYQITDDTDQAVKGITRFYRNFHSSRFVKELFVIRLNHAPTDSAIQAMNEDFADIIIGQEIKRIDPTPEELADDDNVERPRIAFGFNRRDYGRLRQLIDVLNSL